MKLYDMTKSVGKRVRSLIKTPTPVSKSRARSLGIVPKDDIAYIVLFNGPEGVGYDVICISHKPKGSPAEVALNLATLLGIEQHTVIGSMRIDSGVRTRISNDGMEFRFSVG